MINWTLLKKEWKTNYRLFLSFIAIMTMYIVIIVMMFDPDLGSALKQLELAMPGLMAAFGMVNSGDTLVGFMASYLYGFIMPVLPLIFIIVLGNKMVTHYVDNGSMAYLLASPHSRLKIIGTQVFNMLSAVALLYLTSAVIGYFSAQMFFPGQLNLERFLVLNLNVMIFMLTFSGICFGLACWLNESRQYVFAASGFCLTMYLIQMLVSMNEKLAVLKYFTLYSLFPYMDLASGKINGIWQMMILLAFGLICYTCGVVYFMKKDLSI
ncbi:MAG: ABC transporter permease subunit [Erysipelotrichaceae bacterium]|nr:ABC transporter permease subunit [Erysipelotrichaceae bacterium]